MPLRLSPTCFRRLAALASLIALSSWAACGGDEPPPGGGAGGGGAGTTSSSGGGGQPDPGSAHTPAAGCQQGFTPCGEVCAHLDDDYRHCGQCDLPCQLGEGCVAGQCVVGQGCSESGAQLQCGEACTYADSNADHCGSCENRCADAALCVGTACAPGGGDGTSCASPLFWDLVAEETVGFRMSPALSTSHTFRCGPLEPIPTRWFRITLTKPSSLVEVRSHASGDDYLIEVHGAPTCDEASFVSCSDNASGTSLDPELPLEGAEGTVFHVAVGVKGVWSGAPAQIRADH